MAKKKILLLSDDIRTHSGVGTQARQMVLNTAHHFNWVNLGGAINHPDAGKNFDISQDTIIWCRNNVKRNCVWYITQI